MIYDFFDPQGHCRWSGSDYNELLAYVRAKSRRPPRHGTREYFLHVRLPGQPVLRFELRMQVNGSVTAKSVQTYQALPNLTLEDILGNVLAMVPPVISTPPPTGGTIWERLRDPWPSGESPAAEGQPQPRPAAVPEQPGVLSEREASATWDSNAVRARARRPPRRGTRAYSLQVRLHGQPVLRFELRAYPDGRITAKEVQTFQTLDDLRLDDVLRNVLALAPPVIFTPSSPTGRTVWERLRDPWPATGQEMSPEEQHSPPPPAALEQPGLLSAAELEAFAHWDPTATGVSR